MKNLSGLMKQAQQMQAKMQEMQTKLEGMEIEGELVDAARQLAGDFDPPVDFDQGSFIPRAGAAALLGDTEFAWLTTEGAYPGPAAMSADDFDVIFAYPWPDEECLIEALFEAHAAAGEVLVTYHGGEGLRLRRKLIQTRGGFPDPS